MHNQAIPYFCRALSQDENAVRMRGRWKNIAEYITQYIRVVSCGALQTDTFESKYEQHIMSALKDSTHPCYIGKKSDDISDTSSILSTVVPPVDTSTFSTSKIRVVLPMIEYRRQERNSIRVEGTAIILLQRAYRGFRSRALKRRLKARLFEDMRQNNRDRYQYIQLAKLRRQRYLLSSLIQAVMRCIVLLFIALHNIYNDIYPLI